MPYAIHFPLEGRILLPLHLPFSLHLFFLILYRLLFPLSGTRLLTLPVTDPYC